jgi:hypothetical protein
MLPRPIGWLLGGYWVAIGSLSVRYRMAIGYETDPKRLLSEPLFKYIAPHSITQNTEHRTQNTEYSLLLDGSLLIFLQYLGVPTLINDQFRIVSATAPRLVRMPSDCS